MADGTVFLDVGYRLVAAALSVSCGRRLWYGVLERKIRTINSDFLDWSRWSRQIFHRDSAPIRYWITIATTAFGMVACIVAAIIGWQPGS